jgi:hypothetical protein
MKIMRVYADESGHTHFGEIEIPLHPMEPVDGLTGISVSGSLAASEAYLLNSPAQVLGRHRAPRRQLAILLSGEIEVETSDGETRRLRPGSILLAEDTSGNGHITRCLEDVAVMFIPVPEAVLQSSTAS